VERSGVAARNSAFDAVLKADDSLAEELRELRNIGDFSNWRDVQSYDRTLKRILSGLTKVVC
jgi:hypothetical protein